MTNHSHLTLLLDMPTWAPIAIWCLAIAFTIMFAKTLLGIVFISEDHTGIVIKRFVLMGANKQLPEGRIVALNGEAGFQAKMLPPGLHFWYWSWQYSIQKIKFTVVEEGQLATIEAKDGAPLDAGHITAKSAPSNNFQDASLFLTNGGQKGKQREVLTAGVYRINTALFNIFPCNPIKVGDGEVGIVTILDGTPLAKDEIAGKIVPNHGNFQNAQGFIDAGGNRGLQEQVLLSGEWFINPWFAEVSTVPMTQIPIGHVGVVVSYVGEAGEDVSGENFKHGNIVKRGQKGVWEETLDPGKYPINTDIMNVTLVPTTNIVLNWANARNESHKLDEKLSTIIVRSSDGFTFNMDIQQIINISNKAAAKVIARFGSLQNLVSQVLEPTVGNYFRNSAQKSDVIDFLNNRSLRQDEAKNKMDTVLKVYDVVGVDTLIGDIVPPVELMKTLTDRKLAEQQKTTYSIQEAAQIQRKSLEASTASANMQAQVVQAERNVEIAEKMADAKIKTSAGDAKSKTVNAEADASVIKMMAAAKAEQTTVEGQAQAKITLAVGEAEAEVLKQKTESLGQEGYTQIQVADSLSKNKMKLVPDVMISGQNGSGGGMIDALLARDYIRGMKKKDDPNNPPPNNPPSQK